MIVQLIVVSFFLGSVKGIKTAVIENPTWDWDDAIHTHVHKQSQTKAHQDGDTQPWLETGNRYHCPFSSLMINESHLLSLISHLI